MLVDRDINTPYDESNIDELHQILEKIQNETKAVLEDDKIAGLH